MARSREFAEKQDGWLITFADLVMLLLAFFVLVFSMSSLDSTILKSISSSISRELPQKDAHRGKITEMVRNAALLLQDTGMVHRHEGRIKELLFPRNLLPPGIDKGTFETSLRVEERAEGVAFVVAERLLFDDASSRISAGGRVLLESMAPLLALAQGEARVSVFCSAPVPAGTQDDYIMARHRVLAVIEVFIKQNLPPEGFSISAYGADRLFPEFVQAGMSLGRVEILLKNGAKILEEKIGE